MATLRASTRTQRKSDWSLQRLLKKAPEPAIESSPENAILCAPLATANSASVCAVMSAPSKITPEAIITWRKERAQLNAGSKTSREPSTVTPINPACSFNSLAEWSSVDLHVDDTCTKRQPCGASGRMHENDEVHPSDSSSSELADEVRWIYEAAF